MQTSQFGEDELKLIDDALFDRMKRLLTSCEQPGILASKPWHEDSEIYTNELKPQMDAVSTLRKKIASELD